METATHKTMDIAAFNNKDVEAYNYAFRFYYPSLCNFSARYVGDEFAEDIVSDLFVKIWKRTQQFKDAEYLKAFLYHALRNACLDFIKKNKRAIVRNEVFTELLQLDETNYLAGIIRAEAIMELHQAIAMLPMEKGKIIKMTFLDGKSNQETADELGIAVQTVKNQKLRGLAMLRNILPEGTLAILLIYPLLK